MRKYRDYLIEELSDREEAISYLQIAVEEYLKDGDTLALMLALQSVAEAQGERSELALYVYLLRGMVYHGQKEYDRAIKNYTKVIELNPDYADAYYNRATVYRDKGEVDLAFVDYNRAIERNPSYADISYNCNLIYGDKRDLDHAIADFEKTMTRDPNCDGMGLARGASN